MPKEERLAIKNAIKSIVYSFNVKNRKESRSEYRFRLHS